MRYYLHSENQTYDPEMGLLSIEPYTVWPTRQDAVTRQRTIAEKLAITFVPSDSDKRDWRYRENDRFDAGTYVRTPWYQHDWTYTDALRTMRVAHYAHMSTVHPGLIAYTPSEEFGVQDRQLRVKPAKYLIEFAREQLTDEQIAAYVAEVKAFDGKLHLATTADDIETVYMNGPSSCMDGSHERSYRPNTGGLHPCRVYGQSDLAVAYLGTLAKPSARCVVWPDKHIYTRVYGDTTLDNVLRASDYSYGDLDGARVHVIPIAGDDRRFVMPYIDSVDGADRDGSWFVLTSSDDREFEVKETNGTTHQTQRTGRCEHCDSTYTYSEDEDSGYCESCDNNRFYCDGCHENCWDDATAIGGNVYCESCASDKRLQCANEDCDATWFEENLSSRQRASRIAEHTTDLCLECARQYQTCIDCDALFARIEPACPYCEKTVRCDATADLLAPLTPYGPAEPEYIGDSLRETISGAVWQFNIAPGTQCHILNCHAPIAVGQIALCGVTRDHMHVYYCESCVAGFANRGFDIKRKPTRESIAASWKSALTSGAWPTPDVPATPVATDNVVTEDRS